MKRIFFLILLFLTGSHKGIIAQDSLQQVQFSQLLSSYYNLKDALVSGNALSASSYAQDFIKVVNTIDYKLISEGNINALLKDVTPISNSNDLKKQRQYFINLSDNMATIASSVKLTSAPIYKAYCPMKKASWLSKEKVIKNPYYGSSMLSCGEIVETIQK